MTKMLKIQNRESENRQHECGERKLLLLLLLLLSKLTFLTSSFFVTKNNVLRFFQIGCFDYFHYAEL